MKTTDKIIIIDLEATCWQGEVPKGQQNEIIEIGLAVLDSQTGIITKNQGILIKPQRSSVSPFCTELTTITQDLLDKNGVSFEEAIEKLIREKRKSMEKAAKELDFMQAAKLRDDIKALQEKVF